jgi:hypothetical protein
MMQIIEPLGLGFLFGWMLHKAGLTIIHASSASTGCAT